MKYAKAVSASLAGALAVGMVPAMALATDADGIELLGTTDAVTDFSDGSIDGATDDEGVEADLEKAVTLTLDADGAYLVPTHVTTSSGTPIDLTDEDVRADYYVAYYKVGEGEKAFDWAGEDKLGLVVKGLQDPADYIWTAGEYYVAVWPKAFGDKATNAVAQKFTVESAALSDVTVAEKNLADDKDVSDTTFAYKAEIFEKEDFVLVKDGAVFTDAKVNGFYHDGSQPGKTTMLSEIRVKTEGLGKYYAEIEGKPDTIYAGQKAYVPFDIVAYDLSADANLGIADTAWDNAVPTYADIIGHDLHPDGAYQLAVEAPIITKVGPYTATIKSATANDKYIVNTKTVSFNVVNELLGVDRFYMGGKLIGDGNAATAEDSIIVDLSEKTDRAKLFDVDAIEVLKTDVVYPTGTDTLDEDDLIDAEKVKVIVTDAKGNVVDPSSVLTAGTWNVTVKVVDGDYEYGGASETVTYVVYDGTVDAETEAFVKFEGKTVTEIETVYDGKDVVADIEAVVKSGKNTLVAGTDYTVKYEKVVNGVATEVTEIVDAGTYQMTIASTTYKEADNKALEEVVSIEVAALEVYPVIADEISGEAGYDMLWTGEALNPIVKFQMENAKGVLVDLPAEIAVAGTDYSVKISKFVDQATKEQSKVAPKEFVNAGTYTFTIADAEGGNFEVIPEASYELLVDGRDIYVDVPAKAWFANPVYKVSVAGVMGGYGNGKFDPYGDAERQDVAVTMLRLFETGARLGADGENWGDNYIEHELGGKIVLPFKDTDATAYYALAVWYCNKNGLMTGYADGSGEFGVGDAVTREQVAAILFRADEAGMYKAASENDGATILASALDAYKDGADVSKYAVEAMAWAVENGIFGVNTDYLNAGEDISRAELATVLVRYMELRNMDMSAPVKEAGQA